MDGKSEFGVIKNDFFVDAGGPMYLYIILKILFR